MRAAYLRGMTLHFPFDNTYAALPQRFHARMAPTPVAAPRLLLLNDALARELRLDPDALRGADGVQVLAGNAVPEGADPLAQAYAGHQFGGWSPQLGDGRAILLGEIIDTEGRRRDLQLKGSGRTPFSRNGDGRAWLGPVLREYIVSEAMAAQGIPTTRALAATATGETVQRERGLPGAILARVAASHIRVGTFQFFAARGDNDALRLLTDHVIARHYPQADGPLGLLDAVIGAQAKLLARWMGVGFIHGVMNTDNCGIAGETIDYGPCAFMDTYVPEQVFSSIDHYGRYAYNRQPEIAAWNLAQLATALLPIMGEDRDAAIAQAQEAVDGFAVRFQSAYMVEFRAKLGISPDSQDDSDLVLISDLMTLMAEERADFTNTFRALAESDSADAADPRDQFLDPTRFDAWRARWQARLAAENDPHTRMRATNPALIPRNHRIEQAIAAAVLGDLAPSERLVQALARPFDPAPGTADLRNPPLQSELVRQTFCGT